MRGSSESQRLEVPHGRRQPADWAGLNQAAVATFERVHRCWFVEFSARSAAMALSRPCVNKDPHERIYEAEVKVESVNDWYGLLDRDRNQRHAKFE